MDRLPPIVIVDERGEPTPMEPTHLVWDAYTVGQAAQDLAEAIAHIESLDPAREITCHIALNTSPGPQEQEGANP